MSSPSIDHTPDSFLDHLHEWMSRAPWMALSALAHGLVLLILMVIPWELLRQEEPKIIQASFAHVPEDIFEPIPVEEPPPEVVNEPVDEPELMPSEPLDDTPVDADSPELAGEPAAVDVLRGVEFDDGPISEIGIGGGPKGSGRFGRGPGGRGGGRDTERAVAAGLHWLAQHQSEDGSWDSDGFMTACGEIGATTCDGPGEAGHDIGMTGLALLAFLGDGNTTRVGQYSEVVRRGIRWLRDQQDPDTGLLGEKLGHAFLYNHAIGTLALAEAYYFSKSPLLERLAQRAINYITRARNPYGAWRYDVPPLGDNDTSVTGWMVLALRSAEDGGLHIDEAAYAGALSWLDEVTDPSTGRTGYDAIGSPSSRIAGLNEHYPAEKGEAMTAVSLLCRFFLGQDPEEVEVMDRQARLLARTLPEWDPDGFGCDMYYWYYGSYALYQMGGTSWATWRKAMEPAVVGSQRTEGDEMGSWDPAGPWGYAGGRVYSTALMTLCLQVYYRYARVR